MIFILQLLGRLNFYNKLKKKKVLMLSLIHYIFYSIEVLYQSLTTFYRLCYYSDDVYFVDINQQENQLQLNKL